MFRKFIKIIFWVFIIFILILGAYFFIGKTNPAEEISWGVNFSQKHAQKLGLDWKETYFALLDDLGAKHIKIATHWDLIEPEEGKYDFKDLDWQINKAKEKGAKLLLVIGMKTPRWPECHLPAWAEKLNKEAQQEKILELLEKIVSKYKDEETIWAWQIENEPFFAFGECPWYGEQFLKQEIELVKSLDNRPIIISDTGEMSLWLKSAKYGDIIGTTLYRTVWSKEIGLYINFPFRPIFYWRKSQLIKRFFNKDVICVELQTEPWGPALLYDSPLEEQEKTMNLEQFKKNIEFAKKTGLKEFYLWGAEWWYWLKVEQNNPEIWNEAKKLFEISIKSKITS